MSNGLPPMLLLAVLTLIGGECQATSQRRPNRKPPSEKAAHSKASKLKHSWPNVRVSGNELFEHRNHEPCEDAMPDQTGFDVITDEGFLKHASCEDLREACHNQSIGEQIQKTCPRSCKKCSGQTVGGVGLKTMCYDATQTGIRFKAGAAATCHDLLNYCDHKDIGKQVQHACPSTCGECELTVEGPYVDEQECEDLQTEDHPQFTVNGEMSGCSDIKSFCWNHPDSILIRRKCALTCGTCERYSPPPPPVHGTDEVQLPGDEGGCDRRRRYGFCSSRRRRNI
mmetsp:Transcript_147153/g.256862  ORF Transcript_147153/g.256862 Transcript_147153/m.256862 type:complete len:283 (-) Transcript_147153:16-864(-)